LPSAAGIISGKLVQCENCIVSDNRRVAQGSAGYESNFPGSTPRSFIPFDPLNGTARIDMKLAGLASNPIPVLIPGNGSPALNAGANLSGAPPTDQRGLPRAAGPPDLGAVEVQPAEAVPRAAQSISFAPPLTAASSRLVLGATATSVLPVTLELLSGPATLENNTLIFSGPGMAVIRATQPGDAATASAIPVVRTVESPHTILFQPAANYTVYEQSPAVVTLPAVTTGNLPVTWTFAGTPGTGFELNGNVLTAGSAGGVQVRGQSPGNTQYAPVVSIWTLTFVMGTLNLWWNPPPPPSPGAPLTFTLVEGSPHGLRMTARISAPVSGPTQVPVLPEGLIATPSVIPAGETSVESLITLTANPQFINHTASIAAGTSGQSAVTLFLANRRNVPLDVFAPATVTAGAAAQVEVFAPGVPAGQLYGPPPDPGIRTLSVSAVDFDNPGVSVPVTLDSETTGAGTYPRKYLQITFPSQNRRVRLTVTTDDGISGNSGPVQIEGGTVADTNFDGDGINDIVEAVLQRTANQFDPPPLTVERDATGLHAILGSRPLDLKGWTVTIETSADLLTWTAAPPASTTITPNPDGTTERVSVLLSPGTKTQFVRIKASKP
jgi:hypothetical protein